MSFLRDYRRITRRDEEWPLGLGRMGSERPPTELHIAGRPLDCGDRTIAVVGTRRPTAAGLEATRDLTTGLVQAGFTIVSGLALGIDAAAHRTALELGGHTIAVLGSGLDRFYPGKNEPLQRQIAQVGSLVSEYPMGTDSCSYHFPERNRIVAAISKGVLVIEGGAKSGAAITAGLGVDMNREVFAVPASYRNPMGATPNRLIKLGEAALVTEVEDIFREILPDEVWSEPLQLGLDRSSLKIEPDEERVLFFLDDQPIAPQRVCRDLGMPPGAVLLALSRLEVKGWARKNRGGYEITSGGSRVRTALVELPQGAEGGEQHTPSEESA